jgi:hypothetical protein
MGNFRAQGQGRIGSMNVAVKGLEKLTSVRLAELLSQKGSIPSEAITDALYAQDKLGEPFVQVLVNAGHITEWDLAKLVTENFQLPFLLASNYSVSEAAKNRLPKDVLFQNMLTPLDVFDNVVCVVMPVMTPYDALARIQKDNNCELFPYVGLISESKKLLAEMFPDFAVWLEAEKQRREAELRKEQESDSKSKGDKGADWMSIFDAGDAAIRDKLGGPAKKK